MKFLVENKELVKSFMRPLERLAYCVRLAEARSATELSQELKGHGLNPTGKTRDEMERMLSMVYWAADNPGKEFPDQYDPMLLRDKTMVGKDWIRQNISPRDWVLQVKRDGMRSICRIMPDGEVYMSARNKSVKNFIFTPHQDNVLGFQHLKSPFKNKVVLDGELMSPASKVNTGKVVTDSGLAAVVSLVHMEASKSLVIQRKIGSLQYHAFDCLVFEGEDIQKEPYVKRQEKLYIAVQALKDMNPDLPIVIVGNVDFEDAYETWQTLIKSGEEGAVLKRKDSPYLQGGRGDTQIKLKEFLDIDCFVSGAIQSSVDKKHANLVGGFEFSAYVDGKITGIAGVSNISDQVRMDATVQDADGKPALNPKYLNRVAALTGQKFDKNKRLMSARIVDWRPDKDPRDCKLTSDDITSKGR